MIKSSGADEMFGMIKKHDCIWVQKFDPEATQKFYKDFMDMESDPSVDVIPIYISSYGGQVYSLLAMRDLIKTSTKPVATICVGMAMSCGASLLASGQRGMRFAAPDSRIMVHEVSSLAYGKNTEIQNDAEHTKELNELMMTNLSSDCGIPLAKLKKLIKDRSNVDLFMTAAQAQRLGLVDKIVIPRQYHEQERTHLVILEGEPAPLSRSTTLKKKK